MCRFPCEHEFMFILSANCVFLLSSDEDMQSLASLMSMKQADIGNLDDFEEENEEDEENRVNQEEKAAKITGQDLTHTVLFISLTGHRCIVSAGVSYKILVH